MKCILIIVFCQNLLTGKVKPITGTVINEDGVKLLEVNIVSLPSGEGTKTNAEGKFSLQVPIKDRELSFSHIGYETVVENIILYENGTDIILEKKVVSMDSLNVSATNRKQFNQFKEKNNVIYIDMEDVSLRGSMDLGDGLFSEYPVVLKETTEGKKSISIRASSSEEMVFLYDGIRINNMGDALLDLSQMTNLGLSGMELVFGGHEKALSSSGTINFIPRLTYNNSLLFNQQFGTYNYGGYDGFGSLGIKKSTINLGNSQTQTNQTYSDTNASEINTFFKRYYCNVGFKKSKNLEVKLMMFQNEKLFQNIRTNDSINVKMQNAIIKVENNHTSKGNISFFSLIQNFKEKEIIGLNSRDKNDITRGLGFEYEKVIDHSRVSFSTETHLSGVDWGIDTNIVINDRQSSIFRGSFEIFKAENKKKFQFKDLKFIFSKHRVTDISDTLNGYAISGNSWDNNNTQFTASFLNKQPDKKMLLYVNLGNVFRVPSVNELINNQVNSYPLSLNKLVPEQKTMYEFGMKINNDNQAGEAYYNAVISGFTYYYFGKIKQIYFSGNPIKYPINYGQASLSGIEMSLRYQPNRDWINLKSHLSNYFFSDPSAFQLQPDRIFRNIISITNKWLSIEIVHRSESSRKITIIGSNGIPVETMLDPITNFDINIHRDFQVSFFRTSFSLSANNLNSGSQAIEGISIYDRRYSLNINVALK